jgi:hypothetical protein
MEFDENNDGKITYKEFKDVLGKEISPEEILYFRQDKAPPKANITCKFSNCWESTRGNSKYCILHGKLLKT